MRPFGSLIDKAVQLSKPPIPDPRLARVNPPVMSRLDEGIAELFDHTCITGELETAADLLALLERWQARRTYADEQQRRMADLQLKRMRGELDRRHIMRGTRPGQTRHPV
jgi:hypothetical protein